MNTYIEDIITWHQKVFNEGATSITFMDDSFTANNAMIHSLLSFDHSAQNDDEIEDIFDF
jgi:hypothetical protein